MKERAGGLRVLCMKILRVVCILGLMTGLVLELDVAAAAAQETSSGAPQLAILDTDIGDDIDDAFALALLLRSPEIKLLGITTAFADTELRARLTDRYLTAVHRTDIPVAAGRKTEHIPTP